MIRNKDKEVLLVLVALIGFGLIQVYSSSYIFALEEYGDSYYFFKKQLLFAVIGLTALFGVSKIPLAWLQKWGWLLAPITILALIMTLVPGVGIKVGGAKRWLPGLMGVRIEPCEVFKIALPFLLATFIAYKDDYELGAWRWVVRGISIAVPMGVFIFQPDFGSFTMSALMIATVVFAYGLPWKYVLAAILGAIPIFYFLVASSSYRMARVMAFLDPWQDPTGRGFQGIQSMLTFSSGGLFGAGLGDGQGKLLFLPEAHTDFTLAVLGEEMGYFGFVLLLALYGYLVVRGLQISNRAHTTYLKILALGLTVCFAFSVAINMGVVLGLLPTKGLTLPFLSYGGSSLVMSCVLFGILLNIQRQCRN